MDNQTKLIMIAPEKYIIISTILFCTGLAGVVGRTNILIMLMSIELMLNAGNLALVAFSQIHGLDGQVLAFFVISLAAAEVAVGLALVTEMFKLKKSSQTDDLKELKM